MANRKKRKNNHSIYSIRRMTKKCKRHALVPRNLDIDQFGDKADKIALILDRMYRARMCKNDYGFKDKRWQFSKPVGIYTKRLVETLHEPSAPLLDMICRSERHVANGTQPIAEVIVRVKPAIEGKRAAQYVLAEPYRVKPKIQRLKRTKTPLFSYDKEAMDEIIAGWSENYQTVCGHIKGLSLAIDEGQCKELIERIRSKYIQDERQAYIKEKVLEYKDRHEGMSDDVAKVKATESWDKWSDKRIAKLDEKNYDRLLFIEDKVLEMSNRDEMPIYSCDSQGRLHYYLTNLPEELRPYVRLNGCKMVSYDLKTSQPVFIWIGLRDYIEKHNITLTDVKKQADEIIDTIKQCNDGVVPDYVLEGFETLKRKRRDSTLADEMKELGKVLGRDFYEDIMKTIEWSKLSDGSFDRKGFKAKVLFSFLYGTMPRWTTKTGRKTIMHYFIKKFPAIYCVLWRMRRFTEICLEYHSRIKDKSHLVVIKDIKETYKTADFPKDMQRREAEMFFNVIIPQIDIPLVTIHDSIIVESGKGSNVAEIIRQAFSDMYQIDVRVTCEHWHKKGGKKKKNDMSRE